MVLPDENERYGCVPTGSPAGMDQSVALWLQVVRTRTITGRDCLHKLRKADLRGIRGSGGAWFLGTALTIIQSYN